MKQLTQAVFDLLDCPEWAKSAAVDSDGEGYYYSATKDNLTPELTDFWVPMEANIKSKVKYREIKGVLFEATNWQQSAINRGE